MVGVAVGVVGSEDLVDYNYPGASGQKFVLLLVLGPRDLVVALLVLYCFEIRHAVLVSEQQLWADVIQKRPLRFENSDDFIEDTELRLG